MRFSEVQGKSSVAINSFQLNAIIESKLSVVLFSAVMEAEFSILNRRRIV
jgi:hypothetical protein